VPPLMVSFMSCLAVTCSYRPDSFQISTAARPASELDGAGLVHLFAHDLGGLLKHPQPKRQVRIGPRAKLRIIPALSKRIWLGATSVGRSFL